MAKTASRRSSTSTENDIFTINDETVPTQQVKAAGTTEISFDGLLLEPLALHEDLKEGCGGQLWPAGMTLSKYMLTHHKDDLLNKAMYGSLFNEAIRNADFFLSIEIGAGGGLVGLAVAKGCELTTPVVITDQEPMLALMEKNIALNNLGDRVVAAVYDWGGRPPENILRAWGGTLPEVVLAADCVYFEPAFPLLLRTLADLAGPRTMCYFCFKKRRKADWRFVKQMKKDFTVEQIDYADKQKDQREGIYLYEVRKKTT